MRGWKNRKTFSRKDWVGGIFLGEAQRDTVVTKTAWEVMMTADGAVNASLLFVLRDITDNSKVDFFVFPFQIGDNKVRKSIALGWMTDHMLFFPLAGVEQRRKGQGYYDNRTNPSVLTTVAQEFYVDLSNNLEIFKKWAHDSLG